MLLLKSSSLPDDDGWIREIKLDGYRAFAFKSAGKLELRSRNDNDMAVRYPIIAKALAKLPDNTVVDGELVALDEEDRPSFNLLQNYGNSSGPLLFFLFDLLVVAIAATMLWSVLDRRRTHYRGLHAWFVVFIRICLGGMLLYYGAVKVIPVQMPAPPLAELLRPFGQLSPNWVLWLQVGSSYPYEIALGAVELAAGILLFWPRTAILGALLALASMAQVFLYNMTFGVSVKILSFHLLVLAVVLLAPQAKRLADVFVLQRSAPPFMQPALFSTPCANKAATAIQLTLGCWVLVGSLTVSWLVWTHYGGGRPKPALYGIWEVTTSTRDGAIVPPLTTQRGRWQRLIIDEPDRLSIQSMDDVIVTRSAAIDAHTITLNDAALTVDRPASDRLNLAGQIDGHHVTMTLRRLDLDTLPLRRSGFHWVQEFPDLPPDE